mmetsp:Transcript_14006/g.41364  ORF Transcript_14006/g.41364 Transcript_14006/m.41364 type:complete len:225 (-) Transcript_14006:840-1514(-)
MVSRHSNCAPSASKGGAPGAPSAEHCARLARLARLGGAWSAGGAAGRFPKIASSSAAWLAEALVRSTTSATTASRPRGSVALPEPMPPARSARTTRGMSTPVSRCTLRPGCSARLLWSSFAFSREPTTTRAERLSMRRSKSGSAASRPANAPCSRTPCTSASASSTASLRAWFAPCALKGVIGCAASPIRVTRSCGAGLPARPGLPAPAPAPGRSTAGSSTSRS